MKPKKVIIIGAGIGGIVAGYRLQKAGLEVVIYDQSDFIGGRTKSMKFNGFSLDVGAGILPGAYVDTRQLLEEAGLKHLVESVEGNCIIPARGQLHALDMGHMFRDLLFSRLVNVTDKLRLAKLGVDILKNSKNLTFHNMALAADTDTMTVSDYCDKYFTPDIKSFLLGPFVRTMYLHSPEEASVTELLWCMKNLTGSSFSLKGGMDSLAIALAKNLDVRLGSTCLSLIDGESGVEVTLQNKGDTQKDVADFCYIATDAPGLNTLYGHSLTARQTAYLANLKYCPDIVVTFCLEKKPALDALLVLVPESVDKDLAAIVLDHNKGEGRVPEGKGMLTCHFMTAWGLRMLNESDQTITAAAIQSASRLIPELQSILHSVHIERWQRAATRAELGTFKALSGFMDDIKKESRVFYGGDYMALSSVNVSVAIANNKAKDIIAMTA